MNLFYEPYASDGEFLLNKEEAQHCIRVLRNKIGDVINVVNGKGTFYKCTILNANIKNCKLQVLEKSIEIPREYYLHIAIAPTKHLERIEWFIEKAVEIGVDEISFFISDNSERKVLKLDRIERKAISAMKQSLKATLPIINHLKSIDEVLSSSNDYQSKFVAYVDDQNPVSLFESINDVYKSIVLIGPEGDFSTEEVEMALTHGFRKVNLGKSRLRTETAGIVACSAFYS